MKIYIFRCVFQCGKINWWWYQSGTRNFFKV